MTKQAPGRDEAARDEAEDLAVNSTGGDYRIEDIKRKCAAIGYDHGWDACLAHEKNRRLELIEEIGLSISRNFRPDSEAWRKLGIILEAARSAEARGAGKA